MISSSSSFIHISLSRVYSLWVLPFWHKKERKLGGQIAKLACAPRTDRDRNCRNEIVGWLEYENDMLFRWTTLESRSGKREILRAPFYVDDPQMW